MGKIKHCVVKRKGHKENYDERKVYGSVYAACYVTKMAEKKCERVASDVAKHVTGIVKKGATKNICLDTRVIKKLAAAKLRRHNRDAAFMYETHRDVN